MANDGVRSTGGLCLSIVSLIEFNSVSSNISSDDWLERIENYHLINFFQQSNNYKITLRLFKEIHEALM